MDLRRHASAIKFLMSDKNNLRSPEAKNRWLAQSRRWHRWGGVTAGLFLLLLATTGIILNYKQPIFTALGIPAKRERDVSPLPPQSKPARVEFTTDGITGGAVTFEQALALAKNEWGDAVLERAEIRTERSGVTFRFRNTTGEELWVDAADSRHAMKGEYERISRGESGREPVRTTDWGKIVLDLHTGKIGGEAGKALMTIIAVILLLLILSGVYMWLKPLLIRRQNVRAKSKEADALAAAAATSARTAKPEFL